MRTEENNSLTKTFQFQTFEQAMERMQGCLADISTLDHHPEWTNIYNRVEVKLSTHDAGNTVTDKDHQLSDILDKKYNEYKKTL